MSKINIGIADDHEMFRDGLKFIFEKANNLNLIFEASNGQELIDLLETNIVDVILLDLKMPLLDGIKATKIIKEKYPEIKIVILTTYQEDEMILNLMDSGANGYLLKNNSYKEVLTAIQKVYESGFYFNDHISQVMLKGLKRKSVPRPGIDEKIHLTKREYEILQLIAKEMTTIEMANQLCISERTVESHRKNLLEKFEVKNTVGLVLKAKKGGFLPEF